MTDLLDHQIRDAIGTFLNSASPANDHPADVMVVNDAGRRPWPTVTVGVAAAATLTVVGVVALRSDPTAPQVQTAITSAPTEPARISTTVATTPATTMAAPATATLFDSPPLPVTWQVVRPDSSIGRSMVSDLVAGPGGFVAIGMGTDDGRNQGRVWFTTDGVSWDEPALETFDAWIIGSVTATSSAYYVLASPNPDRTDAPDEPSSVFRSTDGHTWSLFAHGPLIDLFAAGDTLLAVAAGDQLGTLVTSDDGIGWDPATFVGTALPAQTTFDSNVVSVGGRYFMRGLGPTRGQIWMSDDGRSWQRVPDTSIGGSLAATDRDLFISSSTQRANCPLVMPPDNPTQEDMAAIQERMWSCTGRTTIARLGPDVDQWIELESTGLPESPMPQQLLSFGNALLLPVLSSEGHLSLFSSTDGQSWTIVPDVDINTAPNGTQFSGSPQRAIVATSDDVAIIAAHADDRTNAIAVMVGRVDR